MEGEDGIEEMILAFVLLEREIRMACLIFLLLKSVPFSKAVGSCYQFANPKADPVDCGV